MEDPYKEANTKLREQHDRDKEYIRTLKAEILSAKNALSIEKSRVAALRKSAMATSPAGAIITHLEREVFERDNVIEQYKVHYQKFGHFYTEYEKAPK